MPHLLGVGMKRLNKKFTVYLDPYLSEWLEGKAIEGYNKAALVRHILTAYAKNRSERHGD
jgi:hypothetical protein